LSEPRDAIEEIIKPFLIQKGFIQRAPRGRPLTAHFDISASPIPRSSVCSERSGGMTPSRASRLAARAVAG
jgi:hypothetical protein